MKRNLIILSVYAVAMAYLEATVVVHLRELYYPENPLEIFPPRFLAEIDLPTELVREFATVVMMLSVALLAERSSPSRAFAAFIYVFGVWDLFYYIWLKVLIRWPVAWLEWDVLFLIPWVWLGPWICPAMISLLFIGWGGYALSSCKDICFTRARLAVFLLGASLGVLSFLQPVVPVMLETGVNGVLQYTPNGYCWWLFVPSYLLMAGGLAWTLRRSVDDTKCHGTGPQQLQEIA